jgi:hypothetical protein
MSCLAIPVSAAEANNYQITFDGSVSYLSTGEKGNVIVNVGTDRPAGNYTWNAAISGGTVTPTTGTGSADNFTLTVTAPTTTGDLTLTVAFTNGAVNSTAKYTIHVVKPVVITAQVRNSGNVTMQNVGVQFKADGAVVNTTTFTISANSTKTLTYNWTAPGLGNGEHTVEIVLDPNSEFVSFIDGSKTFSSKFYIGDAGWGLANLLLTIVFALLLLVLFFTYMNKGRKKRS